MDNKDLQDKISLYEALSTFGKALKKLAAELPPEKVGTIQGELNTAHSTIDRLKQEAIDLANIKLT